MSGVQCGGVMVMKLSGEEVRGGAGDGVMT